MRYLLCLVIFDFEVAWLLIEEIGSLHWYIGFLQCFGSNVGWTSYRPLSRYRYRHHGTKTRVALPSFVLKHIKITRLLIYLGSMAIKFVVIEI